jgi:hypothetical protein
MARYARMGVSNSPLPVSSSKKRKLDDASQPTETLPGAFGHTAGIAHPATTFECTNVSFQVPARKKLKLQIVAEQSDSRKREVRLLNAQTNGVEYALSNAHIDQVFCLPVPEKQQRQSSFVIIPQTGAVAADGTPCEQMVFTMNETKPDDAISSSRPKVEDDTYVTVTEPELNDLLHAHGKQVIRPDENEFASSIPQPHRKGEKAYHVKAHRGTKEGVCVIAFLSPLSPPPSCHAANIYTQDISSSSLTESSSASRSPCPSSLSPRWNPSATPPSSSERSTS